MEKGDELLVVRQPQPVVVGEIAPAMQPQPVVVTGVPVATAMQPQPGVVVGMPQPGYAPGMAQPGYAPGMAQPGYAPGMAQPGFVGLGMAFRFPELETNFDSFMKTDVNASTKRSNDDSLISYHGPTRGFASLALAPELPACGVAAGFKWRPPCLTTPPHLPP